MQVNDQQIYFLLCTENLIDQRTFCEIHHFPRIHDELQGIYPLRVQNSLLRTHNDLN